MSKSVFKTEQFYMPAKFLPPFRTGDRYCFPDGEIWEISGAEILVLGDEEVKVVVHWRRPLHPGDEWRGEYTRGDTNWQGASKSNEIWEKCGSSATP